MNIKQTLEFIRKAHAGQKYGSDPYWTHPLKVAEKGLEIFGSRFHDDAYKAALLHDVIEDTRYTIEDLSEMGYSQSVTDAVFLLTKSMGLSYSDNIEKIISSRNQIALMVKYSDNWINYHGDKSDWPEEKRKKSQKKYLESMERISKAIQVGRSWKPF